MISQELLKENKSKLLAEQARIRKILDFEGKLDGQGEFPGQYQPDFPSFGDDEDENASEVSVYEANMGVKRDLEAKLTSIETALAKIEAGTYGGCIHGDEIEEDRLRALPEAETCIKHSN